DGDVLHRGRLVLRHVVARDAPHPGGVVLERDPELQVAADRARDLAALVAAAELADLRRRLPFAPADAGLGGVAGAGIDLDLADRRPGQLAEPRHRLGVEHVADVARLR